MRKLNQWLYIYYIGEDNPDAIIYERTMPRTCIRQAEERLKVLRGRGQECFYTIGDVFTGAFY